MSEVLGFDGKDFVGSDFRDYLNPLDHCRLKPYCDSQCKTACLSSFLTLTPPLSLSGEY